MIFAKFRTPEEVAKVTEAFNKGKFKVAGKSIWCKPDLPTEIRVPKAFLLGLRYQLTQWEFQKQEVKVDEEGKVMGIGKVPVLRAAACEGELVLTWLDPAWAEWAELQNSPELATLIKGANDKLSKSANSKQKGKGKGAGTQP